MTEGNGDTGVVEMAHGSGGRATARLVDEIFVRHLSNPRLDPLDDGALLDLGGTAAVSTDAFVVDPLFFPGGDIGKLAVCGTVNDVAMCAAVPRVLAAAFVLEEGFLLADLDCIARSMAGQANECGVQVVTGDTKVVPRGKADGVYITTTGLGEAIPGVRVSGHLARPGDRILLSGPVGDHGATIMAIRAGIHPGGALRSDCACVAASVQALLATVPGVHCLRDPTRGGLTAALCEIASASGVGMSVMEERIEVSPATRTAADILGLDPLGLACEGRFVAVVPGQDAEVARRVLGDQPGCERAALIGEVTADDPGSVWLQTSIGGTRLLDLSEGEPLPRIC